MLSSFVYIILPEIQSLYTGPLPNLLYELLSSFFLTLFNTKGQLSQVRHPKLLIRYMHREDLNTHQNYWKVSMSLENQVNFGSIIHSCNSGMY